MTGIEQKKTYEMAPQPWLIEGLKMYKISDKIINLISNPIENWSAESMRGHTLEEVKA